jgi:hypothetical protein
MEMSNLPCFLMHASTIDFCSTVISESAISSISGF